MIAVCEFRLHGAGGSDDGAKVFVLLVDGDCDVVDWVGDFVVVFVM